MSTLYIKGRETVARLDDRRVSLNWSMTGTEAEEELKVPMHEIDRVVLLGMPTVTMPLLYAFQKSNLPVFFLTSTGRWRGSLMPNMNGNSLRRMKQYRAAEDKALQLDVARRLVFAKIRNMRRVLQRLAANRGLSRDEEQQEVCQALENHLRLLMRAEDVEQVRGYEGVATAAYFQRLALFFPPETPFSGRSRRPPKDAANALMSWTYTIVGAEVEAAVRMVGLDPGFGFLHELSLGRPSLAYDLLEPLRAPLCDLMVLNLLNHRILTKMDFERHDEDGGVYLKEESHRRFFHAYEEYMERQFREEKDGAHVTFRRVIQKMVQTVCARLDQALAEDFFLMP